VRLRAQLRDIGRLKNGWDGPGSKAPDPDTIKSAWLTLEAAIGIALPADRVVATYDGEIELYFFSDDVTRRDSPARYALLACAADEVRAVLHDWVGNTTEYCEAASAAGSWIHEALQRMEVFLRHGSGVPMDGQETDVA